MISRQRFELVPSRKPIPLFQNIRCSLENRHAARTNRLRVSQIAAALLFELGTVDIR
jgi:hypothetical protein